MADMYADLARPPLTAPALERALLRPDALWSSVRVTVQSPSTNAELAAAARAGAVEGSVLVTEWQTGGRGRQGRTWLSPPQAGLTFSVLLHPGPDVARARWGWLPLLAGLSLVRAVRRLGEVEAALKWPNDLLLGGLLPGGRQRKAAGLLAEVVDHAVVVGIGLNVSTRRAELPGDDATSLALEGALCTDRATLLVAVLRELAEAYVAWRDAGGDPNDSGLGTAYATACATLGRQVRVLLPAGRELIGLATGIDDDGRLVVRTDTGDTAVAAGDVLHVR